MYRIVISVLVNLLVISVAMGQSVERDSNHAHLEPAASAEGSGMRDSSGAFQSAGASMGFCGQPTTTSALAPRSFASHALKRTSPEGCR
jgi:hypothetical protein